MESREKLAIFDLDGTLFDTKNVNYKAYCKAIKECGFEVDVDYSYYCEFCNGNSYKVFLPIIVPGITEESMYSVHEFKKQVYVDFIDCARKNQHLFALIDLMRREYQIALVTTASRKNTDDILGAFNVSDEFDYIFTQEDVKQPKPDPEGFLLAMKKTGANTNSTLIFEDSDTGIEAAQRSGANYIRVYGYN